MDTNNFRPTSPSGESTVTDEYDWRTMLQPGARQKICIKIMDTLKRHLPFSGQEGLKELRKIAERFEEKIFRAACSQTDYLRRIALKMLTMKSKSQNTMPYPGSNSKPLDPASCPGSELSGHAIGDDRREEVYQNNFMDTNTWRPTTPSGVPTMYNGNWRASLQPDSRQRIVNKIMDTLKRHLPFLGQEGLKELRKIAERFEEKIFRAACSQTDYLRRISLKMLTMESKSQNTMPYPGSNSKPHDPASRPGSELSGHAIGDDRPEEVYQNNFMDTNTWKPTPPSGVPTMYNGDWRASLQPDSRQRIVNKIMDTLKRHLPFLGQEGLKELRKIAERFEEKIFRAACSQTDYLRRISLKMLTMESKSQNTMPYPGSNSKPHDPASRPGSELSGHAIGDDRPEEVYQNNFMDTNTWRPTPPSGVPTMYNGDWRASLQPDSRQRIVNKIMDTLKRHLPFSGQEGLKELRKIAERFEENIFRAACSQTDYLKRISLKMVVMDSKCQNTMLYAGSNSKLPYPGFEKANGNTSTTDFGKPNIAEQPHDDPMAKVKPRSVESLVLKSAPKSDDADRRGKKRLNPPRQSEARKALKTETKIETHLS